MRSRGDGRQSRENQTARIPVFQLRDNLALLARSDEIPLVAKSLRHCWFVKQLWLVHVREQFVIGPIVNSRGGAEIAEVLVTCSAEELLSGIAC
jgi:hypothetical protein